MDIYQIQKCSQHEQENCVIIVINDCEFHTNSTDNRKLILEELEWLE